VVARFYAESFAPWCERARWALDHHGVAYREIAQVPLVAEVSLRIAARQTGRVTVPLFVDGDVKLMSSDAIARHADRVGRGASLFARETEIAAWMVTSESNMTAGRALLLPRIAANPAALREQFPVTAIASLGVRHLMSKYAVRAADSSRHDEDSRHALASVRTVLADGREFLVGNELSYADITIAAALQFVRPVDERWISLGPATREAWTNTALAEDHADLLAWRDRLYAEQRVPRADRVGRAARSTPAPR
jgi:glutathione S-transferase